MRTVDDETFKELRKAFEITKDNTGDLKIVFKVEGEIRIPESVLSQIYSTDSFPSSVASGFVNQAKFDIGEDFGPTLARLLEEMKEKV